MNRKGKVNTEQSGNIFTVLIAAVALVGVVSIASMNMLSGPVATSSRVMQKTMADSQMFANNKIVILSATNQTNNGDCEVAPDGFIEPSPWRDASGNGPDGVAGSDGGGFVPNSLGLTTTDPWGTEYGYCAWDVGTVDDAGCGGAAQLRLAGSPTPTAGDTNTQYVLTLISAGQDRIFQTQCKNYVNGTTPILIAGGDDVVQAYTYTDATAAGNGLWNLDTSNATMATIDKAVKFVDQTDVTITCNAASVNAMRYNAILNTIQKCDGVAGTWSDVGSGIFTLNTALTPNVIHNSGDQATNDFVFGAPQLADSGNNIYDTRFFFDKSKGAFRAGRVTGTNWDDSNVGINSVSLGGGARAIGYGSIALGHRSSMAGASDSVVIGIESTASGNKSMAFGYYAVAAGGRSYAIGEQVSARGLNSIAMGHTTEIKTTGINSFAFGLGEASGTPPSVSGANSFGIFMGDQTGVELAAASTMAILGGDFVVGAPQLNDDSNPNHARKFFFNKAKGALRAGRMTIDRWDNAKVGFHSVAMGNITEASGNASFAMGNTSAARGVSSVVLGHGTDVTNTGSNSFAFGLGVPSGTRPRVSAANSFGIFMGDHASANISTSNTMAILGGEVVIGSETDSGTNTVALKIVGEGIGKGINIYSHSSVDDGQKGNVDFFRSGGTEDAQTTVTDGMELGSIRWSALDAEATPVYVDRAQIKAVVNGTISGNNVPTDLAFLTGTTTNSEQMRIRSDGRVGIGTAAPTAGYRLDIIGDLRVQGSVTTCSIGNGVGATSCTSDARLKENIKEIDGALDKIAKIKGVTFNWIDKERDQSRQIGLIAQDIERVFPEIVMEMPDGMKAVDYAALVSPLIEASKELKNKNDKLEQELNLVKQDIEKLKAYTGYKNDKASFANITMFTFMAIIFALFGFGIWRQKRE